MYPGGDHEAMRPFADRKGFVRSALRSGVPIVASVSCGAHDTTLVLTRGATVAERLPWLRRFRL